LRAKRQFKWLPSVFQVNAMVCIVMRPNRRMF
jgi:hypothetical protein